MIIFYITTLKPLALMFEVGHTFNNNNIIEIFFILLQICRIEVTN